MTSPLNNDKKREQIATVALHNPADADMQAGVSCCQSQPPIMPCHAGWTCIESILVRTQLCLSHMIYRVTSLQASDKRWRESESSQLA